MLLFFTPTFQRCQQTQTYDRDALLALEISYVCRRTLTAFIRSRVFFESHRFVLRAEGRETRFLSESYYVRRGATEKIILLRVRSG